MIFFSEGLHQVLELFLRNFRSQRAPITANQERFGSLDASFLVSLEEKIFLFPLGGRGGTVNRQLMLN
jgi:hypothetical protein